ncbi:DUF4116 domain-containing protein [Roseateles sp. PN1]|uniref:DUF4116 domain-containing protein n=1 Tax=Roseateles sp. PN1 TaxID=3137372 RepID=UPI0031386EAE
MKFPERPAVNMEAMRQQWLSAIAHNPMNLQFAPPLIKNDMQVVLLAVCRVPDCITFASPLIQDLCRDKDPVKALESFLAHQTHEPKRLTGWLKSDSLKQRL